MEDFKTLGEFKSFETKYPSPTHGVYRANGAVYQVPV